MVIMQVSSLFLAFVEKADMNLQATLLNLKQAVFWEFCEANGASPTEASNIVGLMILVWFCEAKQGFAKFLSPKGNYGDVKCLELAWLIWRQSTHEEIVCQTNLLPKIIFDSLLADFFNVCKHGGNKPKIHEKLF